MSQQIARQATFACLCNCLEHYTRGPESAILCLELSVYSKGEFATLSQEAESAILCLELSALSTLDDNCPLLVQQP